MDFYTVMLKFDRNDTETVPCICYDQPGRNPYMTVLVSQAHEYAEQLRIYNPGCEYEVYILSPLQRKL